MILWLKGIGLRFLTEYKRHIGLAILQNMGTRKQYLWCTKRTDIKIVPRRNSVRIHQTCIVYKRLCLACCIHQPNIRKKQYVCEHFVTFFKIKIEPTCIIQSVPIKCVQITNSFDVPTATVRTLTNVCSCAPLKTHINKNVSKLIYSMIKLVNSWQALD